MLRQTFALAACLAACSLPSTIFAAGPLAEEADTGFCSLTFAVGKYWNGAEAEALKRLSFGHPFVLSGETAKLLDSATGLQADQVETASIGSFDDGFCIVIRTRLPFDQDKVAEKFVPKGTEQKSDAGHVWKRDESRQMTSLADHRTLILLPTTMQRQFTRLPLEQWSADQLSVLDAKEASKTLLVFQVSPRAVREWMKPDDRRAEPFRPLAEAQWLRMRMEVDQGLQIVFSAGYSDQTAAERGVPALVKLLEGISSYFEMAEARMPQFLRTQEREYPGARDVADSLAKAIEAAQTGLHEAKAQRNGNEVEATVTVKTGQPVSAAVLLLSLVPRARKSNAEQ